MWMNTHLITSTINSINKLRNQSCVHSLCTVTILSSTDDQNNQIILFYSRTNNTHALYTIEEIHNASFKYTNIYIFHQQTLKQSLSLVLLNSNLNIKAC